MSKIKIYPVIVAGVLGFLLVTVFRFNPSLEANQSKSVENEQSTTTEQRVPEIVGGREVTPGAYPFMVMLTHYIGGDELRCGGSLIDPEWVLTAAHCVDDIDTVDVILGRHDRYTSDGIRVTSKAIYVHPDFSVEWHPNNDIALIHLERSITTYNTVRVATDDRLNALGRMTKTIGWGRDHTDFTTATLHEVDMPIASSADCQVGYFSSWTENVFCTGYKPGKGIAGTCFGDSGSPVLTEENGEFVVLGIPSVVANSDCYLGETYSGHTRVTAYTDWIQAHLEGNPWHDPIQNGVFYRTADQYEPNNSQLNATTLLTDTMNVFQEHTLSDSGDEDWFTFTLTQSARIITNLYIGTSEELSLSMTLFDENMDEYDYASLYGERETFSLGGCEWEESNVLPAGTYYLRVEEQQGKSAVYTINQSRYCTQPDQYEPDERTDDATMIRFGEPQKRTLIFDYERDWATFTLTETSDVVIWTEGYGSDDISLTLYRNGDNFSRLAEDDDSGFESHPLLTFCGEDALPAGTYAIRLEDDFPDHLTEDEYGYPVNETTYTGNGFEYTLHLDDDCTQQYEPNNSESQATAISYGETQTHTVNFEEDKDWLTFVLTETTGVVLNATDIRTNYYSPPSLILYNDALEDIGNENRASDYSNGSTTIIMLCGRDALPAGTYYLSSQLYYSNWEVQRFNISLAECTETADPNEQQNAIVSLAHGETHTNTLSFVGDVDRFSFTVSTTRSVAIDLYLSMGTSISVTLSRSDGTVVEETRTNSSFSAFYMTYCNENALPPDDYTLQIQSVNATILPLYTVTVDDCIDVTEPNDDATDATPLTFDDPIEQLLHTNDDEDWFVFTLDEPTRVEIQPFSDFWYYNGYTNSSLYDADLNLLGDGNNFCQKAPLERGTYYVRAVSASGETNPNYSLTLTQCPPLSPDELYWDEYEYDNYYDNENFIAVDEWQLHTISNKYDEDWMGFTLSDTADVVITVQSEGDLVLELYEHSEEIVSYVSNGDVYTYTNTVTNRIGQNDDFYGVTPHIRACDLTPGNYYIMAHEYLRNEIVPEYKIKFEYAPCNHLYLPVLSTR